MFSRSVLGIWQQHGYLTSGIMNLRRMNIRNDAISDWIGMKCVIWQRMDYEKPNLQLQSMFNPSPSSTRSPMWEQSNPLSLHWRDHPARKEISGLIKTFARSPISVYRSRRKWPFKHSPLKGNYALLRLVTYTYLALAVALFRRHHRYKWTGAAFTNQIE